MSRDKLGCLLFVIVLALMLFISMSEGQEEGDNCYGCGGFYFNDGSRENPQESVFMRCEYDEYGYHICYETEEFGKWVEQDEQQDEQDELVSEVINAVRGIGWFGS